MSLSSARDQEIVDWTLEIPPLNRDMVFEHESREEKAHLENGEIISVRGMHPSLFQPFLPDGWETIGYDLAIGNIGNGCTREFIFAKGEGEFSLTQWEVSNIYKYSTGAEKGKEYVIDKLNLRGGVDHAMFLDPEGFIGRMGDGAPKGIEDYAFLREGIRYICNSGGLPQPIELRGEIISKMERYLKGVQFLSSRDSRALYDFSRWNGHIAEFRGSPKQPLLPSPAPLDITSGEMGINIIIDDGDLYVAGGELIESYEGTSDYNDGMMKGLTSTSREVLQEVAGEMEQSPTLRNLGWVVGSLRSIFSIKIEGRMPIVGEVLDSVPPLA